MGDWLDRTKNLIGIDNVAKLKNSNVCILGIGGVGSYVAEALARSGIGHITLIDKDTVDITNINRQLIADFSTLGQIKVDVCKSRLLKINPSLDVNTYQEFYDKSKNDLILNQKFDYIVDAIDSIYSKLDLIELCNINNLKLISSMGTGNKLDPTQFEVTDISKTSVCPLAKIIRKEMKKRGLNKLKVVYSKEKPIKSDNVSVASISFVPSVCGLIIASEVIKDLIE